MSGQSVAEFFSEAVVHHQTGRLAEAEALYRQILALEPGHAEALHHLGVVAHQLGQHGPAVELIGRALELEPKLAAAESNLGMALAELGRGEEAIKAYRRALALQPDYPEALNNLGNALSGQGRLEEAVGAYERALALRNDDAETLNNLGNALTGLGRMEEALKAYRRALSLRPGFAAAQCNLGNALQELGRMEEALEAFRKAVALRPGFAEAHYNVGNALKEMGRLEEAEESYRCALKLRPHFPKALNNLGLVLSDQGRFEEALGCYDQAIALQPGAASGHASQAGALMDQGRRDEALTAYRRALELNPTDAVAHSNLLLFMHYLPGLDARVLAAEHRRWAERHAAPLAAAIRPHRNQAGPERRLRVGYLSADMRDHPVGRFLLPLLVNHDRQQVEVFGYAAGGGGDRLTERLRGCCDQWRSIAGLGDEAAAELIRSDGIDVLVELGGHTAGSRLLVFARKPAPVQVSYLGYPDTTGMELGGYRLSDALADPPGQGEADYSEELVRLDRCAWCYPGDVAAPEAGPRAGGPVVFGSFNLFAKVNEPLLALWGRVLNAVAGSRLLVKASALGGQAVRERVWRSLEEAGVERTRVELHGHVASRAEHLALYGRMDIALDTFPYHGTTTTCEALWMGVPVVSLAGAHHVSRVGVSLLSAIGHPEWVACSEDEYVQIAADLAGDVPRLERLRAGLRNQFQASALGDGAGLARSVEAAYRVMWRRWCANAPSRDPDGPEPTALEGRSGLGLRQTFELAVGHHQAGRLDEAEALYRQVLGAEPGHADALHFMGVIARQRGRPADAVELIRRALVLMPGSADAHSNLGNALRDMGRLDEAIAAFGRALELQPRFSDALNNLGNALKAAGRPGEAVAAYRRAVELEPGFAGGWCNLGGCLRESGALGEARSALERAVGLNAGMAEAHYNLGLVFKAEGLLEEASAAYRRALALKPDYALAQNNLGNVLKDMGRLDEALAAFRQALALQPGLAWVHSNLVYTLPFHPGYDGRAILEEARAWDRLHGAPLRGSMGPARNDPDPRRRLRVGYVSPDFREHAVGRFLLPLLEHHDPKEVEVFAYHQVPVPDGVTGQLRARCDQWRSLVGVSDEAAAELIRQDGIDVLVDLSLHMANNRLLVFARKPAPVQVTWLAYAGTSGMEAMDWRISDPFLDPPGSQEACYSEETVRLPESYWCYRAVTGMALRLLPALERGHVTFGCLNNFCKVNGALLGLWGRIMAGVEGSRLLLHAHQGGHREWVLEHLERAGVGRGRVDFVGMQETVAYFESYQGVDIALDTHPYGGGTTSCDALWMGVPVVSLKGPLAVGRAGWSILSNVGHPEWVAETGDGYVRIAVELAGDLARLGQLRAGLRARMEGSPLMDGRRFANAMEAAYRSMWGRWCAEHRAGGLPGTSGAVTGEGL